MTDLGIKKAKHFSHRWEILIENLTPMILAFSSPSSLQWHRSSVDNFRKLLGSTLKHRGEAGTLHDFKRFRVYLQQTALKQNVQPLAFRKVNSRGFPVVLQPFETLISSNTDDIRFVISLWRLVEVFRIKANTDTSLITDEPNFDVKVISEFSSWVRTWDALPLFGPLTRPNVILSNRAGPNGPATATAFDDLAALKADSELYAAVKCMLDEVKSGIHLDEYKPNEGKFIHSKLGFLSDKAGKTRIFAIGDWWSNVSLSPVHTSFMNTLRRLRSDCTFRQSEIPTLIREIGLSCHTADMTAFTDRFPIELEVALVSAAYGNSIGQLWKTIIQKRSFKTQDNRFIRYSTGNPMGLLSSWAVSTMTHHAVKQWCAQLVYPNNKKRYKYLILGDDCCDSDVLVYNKYKEIIKALGVSISVPKSTSSQIGNCEFAKRLFSQEAELTGLPVHLLCEVREKPEQFIELIRLMRNRGYSETCIESGVRALLKTMSKRTRSQVTYVLSAPETLLGMPPLVLLPEGGSTLIVNPPLMGGLPELSMMQHIEQARREVFWEEVDKLNPGPDKPGHSTHVGGYRMSIPEVHPALALIGEKLMKYIESEDECSVYDNWMNGTDYNLVTVPSIDLYRFKNRGHKATRSRYDILRRTKAFADGTREYRSQLPEKITNFELFERGFPKDFS